jgi:hypothetical protein
VRDLQAQRADTHTALRQLHHRLTRLIEDATRADPR